MIETNALNIKLTGGESTEKNAKDLIWGEIEEGQYSAELYIVYPWKEYIRDTQVRVKDDNGRYIKDDNGKYVTELVKDVKWYSTDLVFKITDGMYEGYAVRGSLSTHPSMIGSAKRFLYSASLFDVELKDLFKHSGTPVEVYVKNKTEKYVSKETGLEVTKTSPYVSYYPNETDVI